MKPLSTTFLLLSLLSLLFIITLSNAAQPTPQSKGSPIEINEKEKERIKQQMLKKLGFSGEFKDFDISSSVYPEQVEETKVDNFKALATSINPAIYSYILKTSVTETKQQIELREETKKMKDPLPNMQVPPDEAQFLGFLAKLINAKNYLEVGVFTGYSVLSVALALPKDGKVTALDSKKEYTDIAEKFWEKAGVRNKIDLLIGLAKDSLEKLLSGGKENTYDFALIDADKSNYDVYYELVLKLVRPGGLIVIDNILWYGSVIDKENKTPGTKTLRKLNRKLKSDDRVIISTLTISDGVTLVLKK